MEFLYYQNTVYFLIFAIISAVMLLLPALRKGGMGQGAISAREAVQLNNSQSAQFIDIEFRFKRNRRTDAGPSRPATRTVTRTSNDFVIRA